MAENKALFETDFSPKQTTSGNTILDFHIFNC